MSSSLARPREKGWIPTIQSGNNRKSQDQAPATRCRPKVDKSMSELGGGTVFRLTGAVCDCYRAAMFYEDVLAAFQAHEVRCLVVGAFAR